MWALCERTQWSQLYFSQTLCRPHPELNGALGGITEALWGVVRLQRDLALSSSRPFDQEDARGVGSSTIFGRGPCRFGGWCLAKRERRCSGLAAKQLAAWRLQAAELAPSWGNSKRLQSWSAWAGSVALLGTTSVRLWSVQRRPLLQDQTGRWRRPAGSRERGSYPHPSSPSGSTADGTQAPQDWSWICQSPDPWYQ